MRLAELSWPDVPEPSVLVVPLGSCEQHGPHLPLDTDTRIADALVASLVERVGVDQRLVVGPTIGIGASGEHASFPGTLSIGTFPSAGQYWIPEVARTLSAEFPSLLINLDLIDVIDGPRSPYDIELRAEDPQLAPTSVEGHRRIELLDEAYVAILPAGHPLADRDEVALSDLAGERLIAEGMADTTCSGILRRAYAASGAAPRYVARSSDHHAAVGLVAAGVGITLLPRLAMGPLREGVVERPVAGEAAPRRRIVAFVSEAAAPRKAVVRVVALLHEVARRREAAAA